MANSIFERNKSDGECSTKPANNKRSKSLTSANCKRTNEPIVPINPERVNENHISKILDTKERDHERTFTLYCLSIFSTLLIFLTLFLAPKNPDLFTKVLQWLGVIAGVIFGGHKLREYLPTKNKHS